MRANTQIHIACRNIGDSQDVGQFFNGTLSESLLWLAGKMSKTSMATRIVIGIGRSKEDAGRGIDVKGAGQSALDEDMKSMLESVFAGEDELLDKQAADAAKPVIDGDDYES